MSDIAVREGTPDELVAVMRVLDAGLLDMDASEVRTRLSTGDCLVAETGRDRDGEAGGRIVGALVLDGDYVDAVAVSPSRRGWGVGTKLVAHALDRRGRLVADFDARVRPFYESLGFDIETEESGTADDRFRGILVRK
ncbi:N-acetyltransferase [Haloferax mediterranei ATCC 33500]|uniref:N-acetyltransferase n=1 Tax=Haloferax mediterranei (strain ATCC 33500 / DSM 1411 / JCM 8866 / NBRC 14739 / NCIMB 2177 / R-4) TaxID=523841 RepID=I3R133_HALMT|nr:GNAT family N-acetyltransferase [Haloferax mediterranei]AFK17943.1 GCN5-related N-acetyltransferase [Haloferax mediterranei ATCC 33500]AHZ22635.1 GNAT family acetyltransferase [Haloferax mediterranei ATCC 33500]EMA02779.1 N-acetyltransferase GCN5 [Haloferax mediterranei ATCC 33500]MDX5988036.1 GNAT family N-acetyltransferase [Haloferax mediterranei ATCC 33500]QCQ74497.1 N-acetyltransferase [Haloferax mediterranei ATCC 33500]